MPCNPYIRTSDNRKSGCQIQACPALSASKPSAWSILDSSAEARTQEFALSGLPLACVTLLVQAGAQPVSQPSMPGEASLSMIASMYDSGRNGVECINRRGSLRSAAQEYLSISAAARFTASWSRPERTLILLATPAGFEPATFSLEGCCSIP